MNAETNVLMVVANQDFRDEEYLVPEAIFHENGIGTKIAAEEMGDCVGTGGTVISPDYTFDEVNVDEYDAIVYVGGAGVEQYFTNDLALQLARDFAADNKIVSAICWAPVVLAKAGILGGRKVTGSKNGQEALEKAGAKFTGEPVMKDEKIITADGPDAAEEFARTIADSLLK